MLKQVWAEGLLAVIVSPVTDSLGGVGVDNQSDILRQSLGC